MGGPARVTDPVQGRSAESPPWTAGLVPTALGWVVARLCVALGNLLARQIGDRLDTPRGDFHLGQGLLTWDGSHYQLLAEQWYPQAGDSVRFFPLYPAIARALAPLTGGREDVALVVVANVSAFAGALVVWKLASEVLHDRGVADRAAWMVSLFPSAFVLAFAYTEGLAVLLTAATLLALHRRSFVAAGAFGLLAAMLRPVGGLVLVATAIEVWRVRPRPLHAGAALLGPVAGLAAAMAWIAASTGDLWRPVTIQQEIRGGFQDPITRVIEPIGEVLRGDFRDVYNLGFMVVLLALMVVAVRRRQPLSWVAYSGVSLVILLSSQVTDSLGRYGLVVVPFVVALAQWAERRWQQVAVALCGGAGLVWLASEAWLGRLVP